MKNIFSHFIVLLLLLNLGCNSGKQKNDDNTDQAFATFENYFLD